MSLLPNQLSSLLTRRRRDGLLFLIGLALLFSPALAAMGFVGGADYQYESTEVVETDDGLTYVDDAPPGTPISEDLACAGTQVERACGLEPMLTDNESLSLGVESDDPDDDPTIAAQPYEFVQLDGEVHRAGYEASENGTVEVMLSSTSASVALHSVSLDPDETSVSSTVVEAAEEGQASSRTAADVPETPIVTDDGYYRVYLAEEGSEGTTTPFGFGLFFGAGLGGVLLLSLARNLRVNVGYQANQ